MFTSARAVTCISHNTCLRRPQHCIRQPQYLFTLARTVTCIGHNTWLGQPQHLFTSADTGSCIGHNTCLCWPHNCPGHWLVAFPDSQGPGNLTGSAQCAGPGKGSSRHNVMPLCGRERYLGLSWLPQNSIYSDCVWDWNVTKVHIHQLQTSPLPLQMLAEPSQVSSTITTISCISANVWRSICTKNILGPRYKRGCQIHELE